MNLYFRTRWQTPRCSRLLLGCLFVWLTSTIFLAGCGTEEPNECGDGIARDGEECDPGLPSAFCNADCTISRCGDGKLNELAGEVCEISAPTEVLPSNACNLDCTVSTCGDGIVNPAAGERCDDGNGERGDGCNDECQIEGGCGDGIIDAGEECDDGAPSATCNLDCTASTCGDGIVNSVAGEQCDSAGESAYCDVDCSIVRCGDGIVNSTAGEECDEGGIDTSSCDSDCTLAECGDGQANGAAGEACDDGDLDNNDACLDNCVQATCGDGVIHAGVEACDDGNNDDEDACLSNCQAAVCGDGATWAGVEECDDGNTVENDSCLNNCVSAGCGDGIVYIGVEECDDGVGNNHDDCLDSCVMARCGDGQLWNQGTGAEECDDGNGVNEDGCLNTCVLAICGDGIVQAGVEECDDSNGDDSDWCTTQCEQATCTDGLQNAGELDVDCGAICGPGSCHLGQTCLSDSDCQSGDCNAGVCQAEAVALALGSHHACALTDTGLVRCWGYNSTGNLGLGHTSDIGDDELPGTASNVEVGGIIVQLASDGSHTCALFDTGSVRCWGYNENGQLGYGHTANIGDDELPNTAGNVEVGGTSIHIATGRGHTCALLNTGAVRCWGQNTYGQLGYGHRFPIGDDELPSTAGDVAVGGTVVQLSAGWAHTCALLDTGAVRCWGNGFWGQLGYGDTSSIGDNELPSTAGDVAVGGTAVQIAAGFGHTCALLDTGSVRCWGYSLNGELGYGDITAIGDDELPSAAGDVSVGGTVVQIALGGAHTCALLDTGAVRCWGKNDDGQLGYGYTSAIGDNEFPSTAGDVSVGGTAVEVFAGASFTCALLDTGAIRCWGRSDYGQLGYGNTNSIGDNELPSSASDVPFI